MVFGFDPTSYDAVLFVDQNKVIKEMLLTEFEAVLDGVVGEPEVLASQQKSLWKTVIATLVENLNRRQTIDRLFGGGLGVDHGERSVEAREGADHVLHESQFQVHA